MADIFSLLLAHRRTYFMHHTLIALQRAWHTMCRQEISAPSVIVERSIAIVAQLEQLAVDVEINHSLRLLRQQLEQSQAPTNLMPKHSEATNSLLQTALETVDLSISTDQTPWLASASQATLPACLQNLGSAWHQAIQQSKDHPTQRLQLAIKMLPYRTAFTEAARAVRAMLRQKPAQSEPLLYLLYWLAAIQSFLSIKSGMPTGAKVAGAISGKEILNLPINYAELGTDQLSLLTVTDRHRLHENWGAPLQHQRLGELNPQAKKQYKQKLNQ